MLILEEVSEGVRVIWVVCVLERDCSFCFFDLIFFFGLVFVCTMLCVVCMIHPI